MATADGHVPPNLPPDPGSAALPGSPARGERARGEAVRDEPAPCCEYPAMTPPVKLTLITTPPHRCNYLPDRTTIIRGFYAQRLPPMLYHRLMDAGFRRSGQIVYQPVCRGCRKCLQIRVPVARFRPDKSQRRNRKRNADLKVSVGSPELTDEKWRMYQRYLAARHPSDTDHDRSTLERFLYLSPVQTVEFVYRDAADELLAVGICDVSGSSLSSVYFYYEPAHHKRGLGIFGALMEIDFAIAQGIPYWYAGYWVEGCPSMEYKTAFRPNEVLHPDGVWRETGQWEENGVRQS